MNCTDDVDSKAAAEQIAVPWCFSHTFLHYIQNGKLLKLTQVTDEKQLFQAEWYEEGNTGNEGIALSRHKTLWWKEHS